MKRIIVPAVVTLLVVVSLIALNGWNRSGEPLQRVTLTERELPPAWMGEGDERGVRLHFNYQARFEPLDARNWLTDERLRSLGFVFDVMPGAPEAADTYRRMLPKVAWVAFEFEGPAWKEIERRRALTQSDQSVQQSEPSHLVPVDASLDRDVLIARYPSHHLVLRAVVHLGYLDADQKGPLVYGSISHLVPAHLTVPRQLKENVGDHYDVDVAVGRLGIPYVTEIRPANPRNSP